MPDQIMDPFILQHKYGNQVIKRSPFRTHAHIRMRLHIYLNLNVNVFAKKKITIIIKSIYEKTNFSRSQNLFYILIILGELAIFKKLNWKSTQKPRNQVDHGSTIIFLMTNQNFPVS